MHIPREKIEEILARTDMAAIIGQYVTLKRSGKSMKGLCPFHNEKTPSFNVHPDRGFYKCFGCGEGGGAIQFMMKIESIQFLEAVRILADKAGITLETGPRERKILSEKAVLRKVIKTAAHYYHKILTGSPLGKEALAYLRNRGITGKAVEDYQLGFAPRGGDFLLRNLLGLKIQYPQMEKAGVARRKGKEYFDYFRDRIIFPISDSQGRPIGLAGRGLTAKSIPKYLNTPETPIFIKRNVLYGLSQAKSAIRKQEEVYVVEGYMDAIALYQAGFENVTASMGTSLTEEQARAISRYTRRVIFAYDSDSAGSAATVRGIEIFEKAGLYVRVVEMPEGEDPDSIIQKKGTEYFRNLTANSQSIISYKTDHLEKMFDLNTPEGKQDFFGELVPVLKEIKGEVRQSEYIRTIAERCHISEKLLREAVVKKRVRKKMPFNSPKFTKKLKLPEEILLNSFLSHPKYIPLGREYQIDESCMKKELYEIFRALTDSNLEGVEIISADVLSRIFEDDEQIKTAIDLSMKEGAKECNEEQIRKFLKKLEHRKIEHDRQRGFLEKLASQKQGKTVLSYDDPDFQEYIASLRKMKVPDKKN